MSVKRRFRIQSGNYGGELTIGEISKEFVDYFIGKDESDLISTLQGYEWGDNKNIDVNAPKLKNFEAWNEIDDKEHLWGMYADAGFWIQEVPADNSDDFFEDYKNETKIDGYHLYDVEAYYEENHLNEIEKNIKNFKRNEWVPVLSFLSAEKGGFGCWFAETDGTDFNPKKLAFTTVASNLAEIVHGVWYDKKELEYDSTWCDTIGKGYYASVGYLNKNWYNYNKDIVTNDTIWESYDENLEESE